MRRRRIQSIVFYFLAAMTLALQAVNARHLYRALVPYHHEFTFAVTAAFVLIPVAVILANTFRTNARDPRVLQVLFGVGVFCFAGELWANLSVGVWEADRDNAMIVELAALFGASYEFVLFTGAVVYSMAISAMTAGLVWAVSNAAQEMLGISTASVVSLEDASAQDRRRSG